VILIKLRCSRAIGFLEYEQKLCLVICGLFQLVLTLKLFIKANILQTHSYLAVTGFQFQKSYLHILERQVFHGELASQKSSLGR